MLTGRSYAKDVSEQFRHASRFIGSLLLSYNNSNMAIWCYCIDTYGAREVLAVQNWRMQDAYPYAPECWLKEAPKLCLRACDCKSFEGTRTCFLQIMAIADPTFTVSHSFRGYHAKDCFFPISANASFKNIPLEHSIHLKSLKSTNITYLYRRH